MTVEHSSLQDAVQGLIGDSKLEKIVKSYIEAAITFKIDNNMGHEERIRPSKIAALGVDLIRKIPDADLIRFNKNLPADHAYHDILRALMYNRLVSASLGLSKEFLDLDVGQDVFKLFIRHTSADHPSVEYLCVMFEILHRLCGDPECCISED